MSAAVSVVVPTHDRAVLLERAVRSVLAQTMTDLEVLVVDDGSSDDTPVVAARLADGDARVRVLRHEAALGAPAARNTGVAAATGEVVAFLDDDDEWLAEKLARQLDVLDADASVQLVGCHHAEVRGDVAVAYRGPSACRVPELRWSNFLGSTSFVAVRRSAGPEGPWFEPSLPTCQDWDLWLRTIGEGVAVVVPEVLCRYSAEGSDRLTGDAGGRLAGHDRILERHGDAMNDGCVAYHRARRLLRERRSAATWPRLLTSTPPRVIALLGAEIAAARSGARAGDPGRGLRRLHEGLAR